MEFTQDYSPIGNVYVSLIFAAIPVVVLFVMLGALRIAAHWAAAASLLSALLLAVLFYGMPTGLALSATGYGVAFGLWQLAWIVVNAIFLHNLTVETGKFDVVRDSLASLTTDRRVQALVIAFAFGALLEGVAGAGAPVAITAAIMVGLGFQPLFAASLALLANTAPVAFGALGLPVLALGPLVAPIIGADPDTTIAALSTMIGRQVPLFSIIIPGFMVFVMAGWRGMVQVLPAVLTAGVSFAVVQFFVSNFIGPNLVDVLAALASLAALYLLLRVWQPAVPWRFEGEEESGAESAPATAETPSPAGSSGSILLAFSPYIILIVVVIVALIGTISPNIPAALNVTELLSKATITFSWPGLDGLVTRVAPITPEPSPYPAPFELAFLTVSGSLVLIAAIISGFVLGVGPAEQLRIYGRTLNQVKLAVLVIVLILALAFVMNYSGATSTLGLAFAGTGLLFPFFSAFIGWLGVFLTGSDTSSNSLFGPMQTITAQQLGVEPVLAGATNSSGGVMGKMISPQNLAVGASAIGQAGREGDIFRMTLKWSLILTTAMGILAMIQVYVIPWIIPTLGG